MVCIGPASCGGPVRQLRTLAPLAQRPLIRGKARKIAVGTLALWPQAALAQLNPESTGSDTDDVGKIGHIDLPAAAMGGIENHFPAVQIAQAMVEPVFGSRPKRRLRPPLEGNRRGISEEEDQLKINCGRAIWKSIRQIPASFGASRSRLGSGMPPYP